jgi:hypothetical protein
VNKATDTSTVGGTLLKCVLESRTSGVESAPRLDVGSRGKEPLAEGTIRYDPSLVQLAFEDMVGSFVAS